MDEAAVDSLGAAPIADDLAKVKAIAGKPELVKALAEFGKAGVTGLFSTGVNTDAKNSERYIIYLGQSGIGLPDESYLPRAQVPGQARRLRRPRRPDAQAGRPARPRGFGQDDHGRWRPAWPRAHWDRVKSRDDTLTYNKKDRKAWSSWPPASTGPPVFDGLGAKDVEEVVVAQPDYFTALRQGPPTRSCRRLEDLARLAVVRHYAPMLSKPFVDESFDFNGKTPTGSSRDPPRWKAAGGGRRGDARRGDRQDLRRQALPAAAEGADDSELVANLIEALPPRHRGARLDGPGDQEEGAREARQVHPQDRLSRRVGATIPSWRSAATT